MVVRTALVAVLLILPATALGQSRRTANTLALDSGTASPPARAADFAWMAGVWRGEGFGGTVDEVWLPAVDGQMTGMFRYARDGKLQFTEHLALAEQDGSVVLKVKHFHPDFTGWEAKDDALVFRLVRLGGREAYFGSVTIRRPSEDSLNIFIAMRRDGELHEEALRYRRVSY